MEWLYGPPGWNARRKAAAVFAAFLAAAFLVQVATSKRCKDSGERPVRDPGASIVAPPDVQLPGAPPRPAPGSGLTVLVADHQGAAIAGASVLLTDAGRDPPFDSTSSGPDGRAYFTRAESGHSYWLEITAEGYPSFRGEVSLPEDGALEYPVRLALPEER